MSAFSDNLTIIYFLGLLVFGGLLAMVLLGAVNDAFQSTDVDEKAKTTVAAFDTQLPAWIEWIGIVLFIGLPLIALGLAFTNFVPPIFYWLAAISSLVISVVGFMVQDIYEAVTSPTIIADAASRIPAMDFIFSNMGFYVLVVWLLIAVGTYAKTTQGGVMF